MPADPDRVESLFHRARDLPPADRPALLAACADPDVRERVKRLLAVDAILNGTAPAPDEPPSAATDAHLPAAEAAGAVVAGRYKLLQPIGEGGMGTVWMAEQTEPVRRRVAVKLVRADRGHSATILARFEAERQAIALMDHPNIAKLLDAGTTAAGQPFFVMELVKGVPLTDYCDAQKLTVPERLLLFVQVCGAVQHAHQKGVIHRDLKPSNVLVESHDGKPVPRVIDFGLAKATGGLPLTERTLFTGFGSVLGTPLYMAPEQATFNAVDVDTRADVYALGTILYELLTGTTPLTRDVMRQAAIDEVLKLVREREAPTPSSRLSSSDTAPAVAANRQTEPARLGRLVRGELDWIVLKALSKDRDRRYESASGFAKDVERFLAHEPVAAGPPTAAYRLRKFVRRNRPQVVAAGLVLLALVAGIIGTTWGLLRADARRQEAEQARANEATQRAKAEENLAFAKRGNEILGSVFAGLDPKASYATVAELRNALRENLGKAVRELEGSSVGDPLEVAAMQHRLGVSLYGLGEADAAIVVFQKSSETRKAVLGADHRETLDARHSLALAYKAAGKLDQAVPIFEDTLARAKAGLGPDHQDTLDGMQSLALAYHAAGRLDEALPLFKEALRGMKAKPGADPPHTLTCMGNLAAVYQVVGRLDEALPLLEETAEQLKATLGPDHPDTLLGMNNLAQAYQAAGKLDRALPLFEESLKLRKPGQGAPHPDFLKRAANLAAAYWSQLRLDLSVPLFEEVLKHMEKNPGRQHPDTLQVVANLGVNYKDAGRVAEAIPLLEEAYRAATKYPLLRWVSVPLLDAYLKAARTPREAAARLDELLPEARKVLPKDSAQLAGVLSEYSFSLLKGPAGAFAEAETLLRECLAIRRKVQPEAWNTFNAMSMLGGALLGQKQYAEAEPLLLKGYEGMKAREKTIPPQASPRIPEALDRLVELYAATGKRDEAARWRAERAEYPFVAPPPRAVSR